MERSPHHSMTEDDLARDIAAEKQREFDEYHRVKGSTKAQKVTDRQRRNKRRKQQRDSRRQNR